MPWRLMEIEMGLPYGYFDRLCPRDQSKTPRTGHAERAGGRASLGATTQPGERLPPRRRSGERKLDAPPTTKRTLDNSSADEG